MPFGSWPYLVKWSARELPRGKRRDFASVTVRFS
jgi:hypothetical protein